MGCHPTLWAAARIVAGSSKSLLDTFTKFFVANQRAPLVDVDGNLYLWNYLRPLAEQIVRGITWFTTLSPVPSWRPSSISPQKEQM